MTFCVKLNMALLDYAEYNGWEIEYYYEPAEPEELEHKGCDESIEIIKVTSQGRNITGIIDLDELTENLFIHLKDQ